MNNGELSPKESCTTKRILNKRILCRKKAAGAISFSKTFAAPISSSAQVPNMRDVKPQIEFSYLAFDANYEILDPLDCRFK